MTFTNEGFVNEALATRNELIHYEAYDYAVAGDGGIVYNVDGSTIYYLDVELEGGPADGKKAAIFADYRVDKRGDSHEGQDIRLLTVADADREAKTVIKQWYTILALDFEGKVADVYGLPSRGYDSDLTKLDKKTYRAAMDAYRNILRVGLIKYSQEVRLEKGGVNLRALNLKLDNPHQDA